MCLPSPTPYTRRISIFRVKLMVLNTGDVHKYSGRGPISGFALRQVSGSG